MVRIQLYILKICTQTNFSASAHPILNPWGWVTHPWPPGDPTRTQKPLKTPPKNLFPEPDFKWLTSSFISSKSTHKPFFQRLPTLPSTSGGGSLAHDQWGPHQNQKQPKVPAKNMFFEPIFKLLRSSCTSSKSAHKPTSQHLPTPSLTPGGESHTQDPRGPHQNPNPTQNNSKKSFLMLLLMQEKKQLCRQH